MELLLRHPAAGRTLLDRRPQLVGCNVAVDVDLPRVSVALDESAFGTVARSGSFIVVVGVGVRVEIVD